MRTFSTLDGGVAAGRCATVSAVLSALLLGGLVGGCQRTSDEEQMVAVAHTVIEKLEGPKAMFFKAVPAGQSSTPYVLHLDLSANMRGYLGGEGTMFEKFAKNLVERKAGFIEVKPFGTLRDGGRRVGESLTITEVLDPQNYDRKDSDFAPVIASFAEDKSATHLILSDGVQWHLKMGDYFGDVKRSMDAFLKGGGSIALMVFRCPYKGEYTSMTRAQQGGGALTWIVDVDTKEKSGRPFVLLAFLKEGDSFEDLKNVVKLGGLALEHTFALTGTEILAMPQEWSAGGGGGSGRRLSALRVLKRYYPSDLKPFNCVRVDTRMTDKKSGYMPLQFVVEVPDTFFNDLKVSAKTAEEKCAWLNENVKSELRCWPLVRQGRTGMTVTNEYALNVQNGPNGKPYRFRIPEVSKRPAGGAKSAAQIEEERQQQQAMPILLEYFVKRPNLKSTRFAWALTLELDGYVDYLIPKDFSTDDDSSADKADRIYNLSPMMGTVWKGACTPGRAVFLTDWMK